MSVTIFIDVFFADVIVQPFPEDHAQTGGVNRRHAERFGDAQDLLFAVEALCPFNPFARHPSASPG